MMSIDSLTLGDIKSIQSLFNHNETEKSYDKNDSHWHVGEKYFLRTVTHHFTGLLIKVTLQELVFKHVCWIAEDGRFNEAMKGNGFNEQEPYPYDTEVIIGRGSLIDASIISFDLPKEVK